MKKFLLALAAALCCSSAWAVDTNLSQYDDVVFVSPTNLVAGQDGVLTVHMNNTNPVVGYQFKLILPQGISVLTSDDGFGETVILASLSGTRTNSSRHTFQTSFIENDLQVLCYSTSLSVFADHEGEIAQIRVHVDEDMVLGDYAALVTGEVISYNGSTYVFSNNIETTISVVGEIVPEYAEGYVVNIAPATLGTAGGEDVVMEIYFDVDNTVVQGKTISFDLVFPGEWYDNYMLDQVVKNSALSTRFYTLSDPVDNEDGSYHFTLTAKSANYYFGKVASTKVGSFLIYQDGGGDNEDYAIADGFYSIKVQNISVVGSDDETYVPAPTCTYVKVGSPVDATVAIEGVVTSAVNEALADETGIATLDMSNVIGMQGTFALIDGRNIILPSREIEVEEVSYTRNMVNAWGTIYMPFELTSDANVQYYVLNSVSANLMNFTPVTTVTAGTPAVFKNLAGGQLNISETYTTIVSVGQDWNNALGGAEWTMVGTFSGMNLNPSTKADKDIYYIANNLFYYADQTFPVAPYRAWFETDKVASAPSRYSIADVATDLPIVEMQDGRIQIICNLNGQLLDCPINGEINIINGKKTLVK